MLIHLSSFREVTICASEKQASPAAVWTQHRISSTENSTTFHPTPCRPTLRHTNPSLLLIAQIVNSPCLAPCTGLFFLLVSFFLTATNRKCRISRAQCKHRMQKSLSTHADTHHPIPDGGAKIAEKMAMIYLFVSNAFIERRYVSDNDGNCMRQLFIRAPIILQLSLYTTNLQFRKKQKGYSTPSCMSLVLSCSSDECASCFYKQPRTHVYVAQLKAGPCANREKSSTFSDHLVANSDSKMPVYSIPTSASLHSDTRSSRFVDSDMIRADSIDSQRSKQQMHVLKRIHTHATAP